MRRYPRSRRRLERPRSLDPANVSAARRFGREYFDGAREQGYGGYRYDGRWLPVAEDIVAHFQLRPGMRVLDVGCAKGFLVKDLMAVCPGLEAFGIDISEYAIGCSESDVRGRLAVGDAVRLPFADRSFDVALSINTLHNLERRGLITSLIELQRVSPERCYVQLDAYQTQEEWEIFQGWVLTAVTFLKPEEWLALFAEAGYVGDYHWTVLDPDRDWTDFAARAAQARIESDEGKAC